MQNEQIAEKIKSICKEKRISLTSLITTCTLSKSFIYDLEKRNKTPAVSKLAQIADCLECSVDYLLGRTDNPYVSGSYINGDNSVQAIQNSSVTINQGQKETDQENQEILTLIQSLPLKKRAKIITMIYDALEEEL